MTRKITLMTTSGCHLCEQAHQMWLYLQQTEPGFFQKFQLALCEISDDEALVERYGIRIPVLVADDSELGWPFELEELIAWLQKQEGDQ